MNQPLLLAYQPRNFHRTAGVIALGRTVEDLYQPHCTGWHMIGIYPRCLHCEGAGAFQLFALQGDQRTPARLVECAHCRGRGYATWVVHDQFVIKHPEMVVDFFKGDLKNQVWPPHYSEMK